MGKKKGSKKSAAPKPVEEKPVAEAPAAEVEETPAAAAEAPAAAVEAPAAAVDTPKEEAAPKEEEAAPKEEAAAPKEEEAAAPKEEEAPKKEEAPAAAAAESAPMMRRMMLLKPITKYDASIKEALVVEEIERPKPKNGEVLVKVEYSTFNPSDQMYLMGLYGRGLHCPSGVGFEGCGRVIENGGGFTGWRLTGKRVAFFTGGGAWAEYIILPATSCVELPDTVPLRNAASALVNPLTVVAFVEIAKAAGHKTLVHTAAASALGLQLIRLAKSEGIQVVCVVRRDEQAEACKAAGAKHVFNSKSDSFDADLTECLGELRCTLGFDAVGGDLSRRVLAAMPHAGTLYLYGGLDGSGAASVGVADLIFKGKSFKGFWLTEFMGRKSMIGLYSFTKKAVGLLTGDLATEYGHKATFDDVHDKILAYCNKMSGGKILVRCQSEPDEELVKAEAEAAKAAAAAKPAEEAAKPAEEDKADA